MSDRRTRDSERKVLPTGTYVLVVLLAAVAVYLPALANGFAYDDVPLIPGDPRVREPARWLEVLTRPYWPSAGERLGLYRPFTTFSFALDWLVSDGRPAWFHAANILWHATASLLALRLLGVFFPPTAACAGALLFAVHPVHSEAVVNIAARAELLAATFTLAACLVWVRDEGARPRPRTVAAAGALYALALLAKESAVVLPGLLALLDVARGHATRPHHALARYARSRGPALAALALPLAGWLALRLAVLGHVTPAMVHPAAEHLTTLADRIRTALQAWPEYARLLFFPRTLLADYGPPILLPATDWTARATLGLGMLVAVNAAGALALARGRGLAALALLWFPIAVLPASNLLATIGVLVAERTLYLPSLALSFAAAGAWLATTRAIGWAPARGAGVVAAVLLLAVLGVRTVRRIPDWRSTEAVFRALLRDRPDASRAHWVLGRLARAKNQPALAAFRYARALALWPYREGLVIEAAAHEVARGRLEAARRLAEFAARTWPRSLPAHQLLAATALDLGDTATARAAARAGLHAAPGDTLLRAILHAIGQADGTASATRPTAAADPPTAPGR